jgi:anti-anti-sigma factor
VSESDDAIPVVRAPREVGRGSIPDLIVAVAPHVLGTGPGLVIDLAGVEFITSAGLGEFVYIGMDLKERGAVLALASAAKPIERLIRQVGLDEVIPLFKSVPEAYAHVAERAARPA